MFLLFGIVIIFIIPQPKPKPTVSVLQPAPVKAAARQTPTNRHPPQVEIQTSVRPRAFPRVLLQGITYRTNDPSVLINGKTFFVGNRIGEAKVVTITPTTAILELDGQYKLLELTARPGR
jgi:hypothetical protein